MATVYSVTVGPARAARQRKGWPIACGCGWKQAVPGATRTSQEKAQRWAHRHLGEHGVGDTVTHKRSGAVVVCGLHKRVSSVEERARFRQLSTAPVRSKLRYHPKTFLMLAVWALALGGALAATLEADQAPEPNSTDGVLGAVLVLVMFGGAALVVRTMLRELDVVRSRQVDEFLDSIGYAARGVPKPARADDNDSNSYRYPVTDGHYDPDLYGQRGGYSTKVMMDALGFTDYDTYRNNFLEAD